MKCFQEMLYKVTLGFYCFSFLSTRCSTPENHEREVVHFQRFGEALEKTKLKLEEKNFYYFNPEFDKQFVKN